MQCNGHGQKLTWTSKTARKRELYDGVLMEDYKGRDRVAAREEENIYLIADI